MLLLASEEWIPIHILRGWKAGTWSSRYAWATSFEHSGQASALSKPGSVKIRTLYSLLVILRSLEYSLQVHREHEGLRILLEHIAWRRFPAECSVAPTNPTLLCPEQSDCGSHVIALLVKVPAHPAVPRGPVEQLEGPTFSEGPNKCNRFLLSEDNRVYLIIARSLRVGAC